MKTMTVYALMGKIYNNNQDMPKKIKYINKIYEWKEYDCGYQEKKKINWVKKWGYVAEVDRTYYYLEHCFKDLHDEVEIIEENNKIEKLDTWFSMENAQNNGVSKEDFIIKYANYNFESYFNKINELIEKVNEIKNEN